MATSGAAMQTRRWTRIEYERLVEAGFFRPGERLELLGGELVVAEPHGTRHATAIGLAANALREAFGPGWDVRVQLPAALDDDSEPEPDLAVVPGSPRDYVTAHPSRAALVVEVAETSLAVDRGSKGSLYARAGVADYWIVNLADDIVEVHRQPVPDPVAQYGWRFASVERLTRAHRVFPLGTPGRPVSAADLLP